MARIANLERLPELNKSLSDRLDDPSRDLLDYLLRASDGQSPKIMVEIHALSHDISAEPPKITAVKSVSNGLCKLLGIVPPIFETKGKNKLATVTGRALLYHTLNPNLDTDKLLECVALESFIYSGNVPSESMVVDPVICEIVVGFMMDRLKDQRDPLKPSAEITERLMLIQALAFAGESVTLTAKTPEITQHTETKQDAVNDSEDELVNSNPNLKKIYSKLAGYLFESKDLTQKDWDYLESETQNPELIRLIEIISERAIKSDDMVVTRLNLVREAVGLKAAKKARYTSWGAVVTKAQLH